MKEIEKERFYFTAGMREGNGRLKRPSNIFSIDELFKGKIANNPVPFVA